MTLDTDKEVLREALRAFVRESNRIEGITRTTETHYAAHERFLAGPITIPAIVELVERLQPDARLRDAEHIPGVRVGSHVAPPSGAKIESDLRDILAMREPWAQHVAYETLHPFTDGNGRSGRAIWLHRHWHEPSLDRWAVRRGFLHSFYYHTLQNVRTAALSRSPSVASQEGWAEDQCSHLWVKEGDRDKCSKCGMTVYYPRERSKPPVSIGDGVGQ